MTKKVNRMSFFSDISRQKFALMPIYFQKKNVHSLKKHCSHAHILSKKRPFFQKRCALMSIFSKFSSKTPCCHAHIWSKTSILSKYTIIWAKKVNMMPFCSDFERNYLCSHAYFLSKNRKISKKYAVFMPMFCQKTSTLSKTCSSHVVFSNFSWKIPSCHAHIWSKKCQFCQNYTIIL